MRLSADHSKPKSAFLKAFQRVDSAFTLIEILLVIALMSVIFLLVVPNFTVVPSTEASSKMNGLAGDIRAAYDMAVLHRKPYRLAFEFKTGDYWLESTNRLDFQLGDNGIDRDLSPDEAKEASAAFEEDFKEYIELAGKEVPDPETETTIPPTSPLIAARKSLSPVEWRAEEDAEWQKRSLGPSFMIRSMQAEHHKGLQTYEALQQDGYAYLYFFPEGYVERAVIHIAPTDEEDKSKWDQLTYTIQTRSWEGLADVESGYREIDITRDENEKR
ncbi:MAG: prepilin-type N-terminal cleavage/methylation domain-containing protein [Proteobacteria bacterium]|nr:MAG: prepilin-type N-terminal cleavage/methylation domain-containing protein [Pseudomonadota bacterium]